MKIKRRVQIPMTTEEENIKLKEIVEYYHEEIEEMLGLLYYLEDNLEEKHNISLPKSIRESIQNTTSNFNFRYLEIQGE